MEEVSISLLQDFAYIVVWLFKWTEHFVREAGFTFSYLERIIESLVDSEREKEGPLESRQAQKVVALAFSHKEAVVAVCFAVACDRLSFLSLIFIYKFYFLINGKRNSNI